MIFVSESLAPFSGLSLAFLGLSWSFVPFHNFPGSLQKAWLLSNTDAFTGM